MKRKTRIFLVVLLITWIGGILFPMFTFTHSLSGLAGVFDRVFQSQISHILMHAFLYMVLAVLFASVGLRRNAAMRFDAAMLVLAAVLAVGVLQEMIQILYEHFPLGRETFFDLTVDIAGGIIGLAVFCIISMPKPRHCDRAGLSKVRPYSNSVENHGLSGQDDRAKCE